MKAFSDEEVVMESTPLNNQVNTSSGKTTYSAIRAGSWCKAVHSSAKTKRPHLRVSERAYRLRE